MRGKKRVWLFILIGVLLAGAFVLFSGRYAALPDTLEASETPVTERAAYWVIGDENAETALIFYPGGKVAAQSYLPLLRRVAENGTMCILVKMPLELAVFWPNAAADVMGDFPQVSRWILSGHSLGGAMAADYAAKHGEKIAALVLLGAYPTRQLPASIPVLSIRGSEDGILNRTRYETGRTLAENFREQLIPGGNHAYFGNYGEQKGDGKASVAPEEQRAVTVREIAKFLTEQGISLDDTSNLE